MKLRPYLGSRAGFTLAEISIAAAIQIIAVALAFAGLAYVFAEMRQLDTQVDLDMDVQIAMERVKSDLRLSSLNEIFFYPGSSAGPYSAMSFPGARDDNDDGAIEVDGNGDIIWDETHIYHVWTGEPNQLRLTTFDPRDNTLTDEERQEQLDAVVAAGNGTGTHNGAHASTRVVFENLFSWELLPRSARFDAYADSLSRDVDVVLGSCVLSNGLHSFKFEVVGKNAASTGRKIGLDSLFVSPSYGSREAEAQLPVASEAGANAVRQYMAGGSWDGNYQLYFPAGADGAYFTLNMRNDQWEETNFDLTGGLHQDTVVNFDKSGTPWDFVVQLDGLQINWYAESQTGDTNQVPVAHDSFNGDAVRVIVRGEDVEDGGWILTSGNCSFVNFRAGPGAADHLWIKAAFIGECATATSSTPDVVSGTMQQLYFGGGEETVVAGGSDRWTDAALYPIEKEKSYAITFLVGNAVDRGTPWHWDETIITNTVGSYVISGTNSPAPGKVLAGQDTWSTRTDVVPHSAVYGVQCLFATYPTNGVYTSPAFDTAQAAPAYSAIDWSSVVPSGTSLDMKVRTGSDAAMSDAESWTNVVPMTSPGALSLPARRYVQFRAGLRSDGWAISTPKLKDVTIKWPGDTRVVDIGGTITKGPDYGIFEVTVDGRPIRTGVTIDLEIFRDARGHGATRRFTSRMKAEVRPRNGGVGL